MQLVHSDLFESDVDVLIVTGNSYINRRGELVMGRGAAKQAADRWPLLPVQLAKYINHLGIYDLVLLGPNYCDEHVFVGVFQVKRHWHEMANPELINSAVTALTETARSLPGLTFGVNFPGIGNGRLSREQVLPIIRVLPGNVDVYEL